MDLHVSSAPASLKLSPANLNVFDSVVIMALIPLVDRLVYPMLDALGCPLSMLQKVGVGFAFAAGSMFVAAYVEVCEQSHITSPSLLHTGGSPPICRPPPISANLLRSPPTSADLGRCGARPLRCCRAGATRGSRAAPRCSTPPTAPPCT